MDSQSHPMRKFYRDITFDNLKERHDNFSFNKAIQTKQAINDTMHFQNLLNKPTEPVMVVFKKDDAPGSPERKGVTDGFNTYNHASETHSQHYNNENYTNMTENQNMFNEFQKRLGSTGDYG